MKNRIRNVFSRLLMFIMAGAISFGFNTLLGGNVPIAHSLICGVFVVIIYDLSTYLLTEIKSEVKAPSRLFLSLAFAFCVFVAMGCTTAFFTDNKPIYWWMYVIWVLFAVFAAWKSYRDAAKN